MKSMDYKILNKNDKIVAYMNKNLTIDETREIAQQLQNSFPNNEVIVIHNRFIDGIDIIKERTEFDELLQPFEDSLNA